MRCPSCGNADNRVLDSRVARDGEEIRRRRQCQECGRRFTTRERLDENLPRILKKDGRREDYDRDKLMNGLRMASQKRPIDTGDLERLADRTEKRLIEVSDKEVASSLVGEWVMEELVALDAVAAARFASVFRDFQTADDYAAFFKSLEKPAR